MNRIESPQTRCLIGVARGDITPPVGIYHRMWGAATHERSTGVHRPLTATVLYLENPHAADEFQVVVALDHCLLWPQEMNACGSASQRPPSCPASGSCSSSPTRTPPD